MPEHVESVRRIAAFFRDQAKDAGPGWASKFETYADQLDRAVSELVRLYGLTTSLPPDLGNIHDLPADLLDELSIAKTDELEDQLVTVINAYGGDASLDQILVGLYRRFRVSQKRRFIQNKLYRMESVWSVEGRKGIYTTKALESDASPDPRSPDEDGARTASHMIVDDDEIPF